MTYTGNEPFLADGKNINLTMNDFWRWAYSDLNNSTIRSMLAKFIVASSLEIVTSGMKSACNARKTYDLLSKDGYRIDVKSAAYMQTLDKDHPDHILFSVASVMPPEETIAEREAVMLQRNSDIYVFCIYKAQTINETPLDLSQWDFYVLSAKKLNEKNPALKTFTLPSLIQMNPVCCDYCGIGEAIKKTMTA